MCVFVQKWLSRPQQASLCQIQQTLKTLKRLAYDMCVRLVFFGWWVLAEPVLIMTSVAPEGRHTQCRWHDPIREKTLNILMCKMCMFGWNCGLFFLFQICSSTPGSYRWMGEVYCLLHPKHTGSNSRTGRVVELLMVVGVTAVHRPEHHDLVLGKADHGPALQLHPGPWAGHTGTGERRGQRSGTDHLNRELLQCFHALVPQADPH